MCTEKIKIDGWLDHLVKVYRVEKGEKSATLKPQIAACCTKGLAEIDLACLKLC